MTGPTREEVDRLATAFRKATFSRGRTVGGVCGQTIHAMMASTLHEVSALDLDQGADALEALAAENAALRERLEAAEACNGGLVRLNEATEARALAAETSLTEARAQAAAGFEAGRDAAAYEAVETKGEARFMADLHGEQICDRIIGCILGDTTPPADQSAALQSVKDAEWDACVARVVTWHRDKAAKDKAEADQYRREGSDDGSVEACLSDALCHFESAQQLSALRRRPA